MNTNDLRRINLDRLIGNHGVHGRIAEFAKANGLDPSYLSQLLNGHRNLGEKAARNIEESLSLPSGHLDKMLDEDAAQDTAQTIAAELGSDAVTLLELYQAASPELRTAALRVLETALHPYSPKPKP